MSLQNYLLLGLIALGLTACNSRPKAPIPELGVLEKISNIDVMPHTKSNSAQLVKLLDHCIIEFNANLSAGRATEKWRFKGHALMNANTSILARDGTSTGQTFDLHDPLVQANFLALKSHFQKQNLAACE